MLANIISGFFSRGFVALSNFAVLLLSANYLGSDLVGRVSLLVLNIAVIQTINEIYTGPALVYFIPKSNLTGIYRQGFLFMLITTFAATVFVAWWGKTAQGLGVHLFCLSILFTLNAFHNVLVLAKEKIKLYNLLVLMQPFLMLVTLSVQVFLLQNKSLAAYIASLYTSFGITLLVSSFFVIRLFNNAVPHANTSFKSIVQNGFINQLGNLAHTLSNRLNYYILGSAALVGVYASSTSLVESIWIISASVSPVVLSHVANQRDAGNNARLTLLLAKLCFLLAVVCVVVLLLLPPDFFTFLLGKDFTQTKMVMLYLSPGVLCLSFSSIISHYFSGLGKQNVLLMANGAGLLLTACTAWFFIRYFGLLGACYSASCAYFVQAFVLTVVFLKQSQIPLSGLFNLKADWKLLRNKNV